MPHLPPGLQVSRHVVRGDAGGANGDVAHGGVVGAGVCDEAGGGHDDGQHLGRWSSVQILLAHGCVMLCDCSSQIHGKEG